MRGRRIKTWNSASVPAKKQKSPGQYMSRVLLDKFRYERKNRKTINNWKPMKRKFTYIEYTKRLHKNKIKQSLKQRRKWPPRAAPSSSQGRALNMVCVWHSLQPLCLSRLVLVLMGTQRDIAGGSMMPKKEGRYQENSAVELYLLYHSDFPALIWSTSSRSIATRLLLMPCCMLISLSSASIAEWYVFSMKCNSGCFKIHTNKCSV